MKGETRDLRSLAVRLHGERIGTILRLAGDKQIFTFEQNYIDDPDRPTLSLSFKGRTGELLTAPQQVHRRVPPFFSNLLPEGHLRSYLAEQAGVNPDREFFLLAALGADLAGAVTVTPLDDESAAAAATPDAVFTEQPDPGRQRRLRFSLAGVQLKFSAIRETRGGLTIPAEGIGGSWIVKLPSQTFDAVSENEFVMLELARAIGIPVPRIQLVPVGDIKGLPVEGGAIEANALAVERFDRTAAGKRIHMEDFAQIFGLYPESKYKSVSYANVARVLLAETGEAGANEFLRRLTFSILIGNADMHLKNWSLLYPDGRTAELAPAYDFVSTLPYIPNDKLALTFGGSRDLAQISIDQIRRFTEKAGLPLAPAAGIVGQTVEAAFQAWQSLTSRDLLPSAIDAVIDAQIGKAAANTRRVLSL